MLLSPDKFIIGGLTWSNFTFSSKMNKFKDMGF